MMQTLPKSSTVLLRTGALALVLLSPLLARADAVESLRSFVQ
ncbi:MAG: hypothetical protein RI920_1835, partial [Pseudomonadota bacterium]